ncbi:DNA excision repair protein 4 [Cavenderia fasciculata]|uniref:DNA excision repair protein 4 n=1 Tax=Cavenderia fasciculata TaxID=261658 RepID=F4PUY3_CACFS|nr:DNA excision repair protein 4 [Cavenderia fasciculata]EGG21945.1 DNA excision repair protein 4 [Cavenderia fasciculata]|eukprot:XP_004359796.1 DNA excision repair protein 4 [Cavenderia fasciculata]
MPLEYHKQIFETCLSNDGLVVMSKGLGVQHVILAFLKVYCDSDKLVLYVDPYSESLQESYCYYNEKLLQFGVKYANLPTFLKQELVGASKYRDGGVYFGPAATFILDMLMNRIPTDHIAGIIVDNAHRIDDLSPEALLLSLFKMRNSRGFIKAFSSDAAYITSSYASFGDINNLQRLLKLLQVPRVYLWPRFHLAVANELDTDSIAGGAVADNRLIELTIPMTESMIKIEKALTNTIEKLMGDIRSKNKHVLEKHRMTLEDGLFNSFDSMVQSWGDIGWHTKQNLNTIKILRNLTTLLVKYDGVSFLKFLETLRDVDSSYNNPEDEYSWIYTRDAEHLFNSAKERVYIESKLEFKKKKGDSGQKVDVYKRELVLEENPKWHLLYQVIKEIEDSKKETGIEPETILVFVKDERTCTQLQEYLDLGGYGMLLKKYDRLYAPTPPESTNSSIYTGGNSSWAGANRRKRGGAGGKSYSKRASESSRKQKITETNMRKKMNIKDETNATLFSMGVSVVGGAGGLSISNPRIVEVNGDNQSIDIEQIDDIYSVLSPPHIIIHPIEWSGNILEDATPQHIIIYDADVTIIRQIEVFRAENPHMTLFVYFLLYSDSIEESKYISILRREKDAFERLIREKASLIDLSGGLNNTTITTEKEQEVARIKNITEEELEMLPSANTSSRADSRTGGVVKYRSALRRGQGTKKKVVVDSFEFKSSLPVALHFGEYQIIPLRLVTGDYVISPLYCIERKSISDLIGSFGSGRLFHQIDQMGRHYTNPILLIEFDARQPFMLHTQEELNLPYISQVALSSKLMMLSRAFPKMRIIWARSSRSTVAVFDRLKENGPEPDPSNINVLPEPSANNSEYNYAPHDVLKKLPGINESNIHFVLDGVRDLHHLSQMSKDQLSTLLHSETDAALLYAFLTQDHISSKNINNQNNQNNNNNGNYKRNWSNRKK